VAATDHLVCGGTL